MGKCLFFVRGRMSRSRSIFSLFAASIAVLVAMYVVLTRNQAAGLHPVEADSISIPLIEGFLTIGLVFVVSCVGLRVPSRGALRVGRFACSACFFSPWRRCCLPFQLGSGLFPTITRWRLHTWACWFFARCCSSIDMWPGAAKPTLKPAVKSWVLEFPPLHGSTPYQTA